MYINNPQISEEDVKRLLQNIDELKKKYAKMGIPVIVDVDDPYKPSRLALSIRIEDIGKYVVNTIGKPVKDMHRPYTRVVIKDGVPWLSIVMVLGKIDEETEKAVLKNAMDFLSQYKDEGIDSMIVPSNDKNDKRLALLMNMYDYGEMIIREAIQDKRGKPMRLHTSVSVRPIKLEQLEGTYLIMMFSSNPPRTRVIS